MSNTNNLPLTSARLSSSLLIKIYPLNSFDVLSDTFSIPLTAGKILSVVTKFERDNKREVFSRYELGSNAFEPRDNIPQKVKTTLKLQRVMLYAEDMVEACGMIVSGNVVEQVQPLLIQEIQMVPNFGNSLKNPPQIKVISYTDCWILTNPAKYDITSQDQIMLQDIDIQCGKMYSSTKGNLETLNNIISASNTLNNILDSPIKLIPNSIKF